LDDSRCEGGVIPASNITFIVFILGKCGLHMFNEFMFRDGISNCIVFESCEISDGDGDGLFDELFEGIDLKSF